MARCRCQSTPLSDMVWQIWLNIRLPRMLLAVLLGMVLSIIMPMALPPNLVL
ncbi:hypothetical protein ACSST1_22340 [Pantoea agglomerans]|uniref:hypothetical protein n=1 Tax=Enterobacter agglomerans TaxID=549 RepID=UPI003EDA0700